MFTGDSVRLSPLLWHPDLRLPSTYVTGSDERFTENCQLFLATYARFLKEEESGRVANTTILQLISSAWQLKKNWQLSKHPEIQSLIQTQIPTVARKYGVSQLWKAGYATTFQRHAEEILRDDGDEACYRCARCGRALSAELSVKRGLGPICFRKPKEVRHA